MRQCYHIVRTTLGISLLLAVTILPIALTRAPLQPPVDASSIQSNVTENGANLYLPRLVAQAEAAGIESSEGSVTVGPKQAPRMHGGSVLTDFLSQ